ncbi:hypothetical protein SDC9_211716 [bioreactor metagenome]|uniref:Uncharacterized protein n=1 Tax=bioreactor metagenome TaxID=1076179 RepID=A0A645JKR6_9ZZZZ
MGEHSVSQRVLARLTASHEHLPVQLIRDAVLRAILVHLDARVERSCQLDRRRFR